LRVKDSAVEPAIDPFAGLAFVKEQDALLNTRFDYNDIPEGY